jgi:type II secretory pathway component PulF
MHEDPIEKRFLWTAGWLVGHFVAALVVLFSLVRAVPMFEKVFEGFDADLPEVTKVLISLSRWMSSYWWLVLVVGFVVDAGMLFGLRCLPPGGRWLSTLWAACVLVAAVCLLGTILLAVGLPLTSLQRSLTQATVR